MHRYTAAKIRPLSCPGTKYRLTWDNAISLSSCAFFAQWPCLVKVRLWDNGDRTRPAPIRAAHPSWPLVEINLQEPPVDLLAYM